MSGLIRVSEPDLTGNERKYLNECIDSGWISSNGPFVHRFEQMMAARTGRRHGIAVSNGSSALEAAVAALGIGHGDEVLLPAFTIISCASAVVRAGATPVVIDADPMTWNMDVTALEKSITPRTRAILVAHTYGLATEMDPVLEVARRHGLKVIEDAAEAHGLRYNGRECGGFGDLSVFSFYANKHVTCGEGGMLLTDDDDLASRCRSLRDLCFDPLHRFVHEELGWNFRMSNLQAAVGVAQLERLDEFVDRKRRIGRRYTELLENVEGIRRPLSRTAYCENTYWVYGLVLTDDVSFDASEAMKRLAANGVESRPFFYPINLQPVFQRMGLFKNIKCSVAERLGQRGLYLPSGLKLTDDQIETVAAAVRNILQ